EMLWMVDLNHLVGFSPLGPELLAQAAPLTMAIVLEVEGQALGLIVPQIEDIEWHESPSLQSPSDGLFPDRLLPFVSGYLTEASSMVLSAKAIAQAQPLQVPS
ncbi:MAG: chemotaxis protein CheW, partial [Cyanobacteria bacterium P01_H01_bin.130]